MGEYGREQRNQLSRSIANSETGSRQLKGIVDNRSAMIAQDKIIESKKNSFGRCDLFPLYLNRKVIQAKWGWAFDAFADDTAIFKSEYKYNNISSYHIRKSGAVFNSDHVTSIYNGKQYDCFRSGKVTDGKNISIVAPEYVRSFSQKALTDFDQELKDYENMPIDDLPHWLIYLLDENNFYWIADFKKEIVKQYRGEILEYRMRELKIVDELNKKRIERSDIIGRMSTTNPIFLNTLTRRKASCDNRIDELEKQLDDMYNSFTLNEEQMIPSFLL